MTKPSLLSSAVPEAYQAMLTLNEQCDKAAAEAGIEPLTVDLVRIRVSQLNGCAFCLRMHVRDALEKGESTDRIAVVSAWRETAYFTETEQAALEIAEGITRISEVGGEDSAALTTQQAAVLKWIAITMNAFNRIAIASHYKIGP
ncbi:carboxymuconolactone decarboxylase family protein [Mycobacterium sp. AZCC_0083]|uniref:carboxymuconolactone decarboxylase family protein n=1 Tax=Mycobacterium sp. AZCC_0083 TaxID=2735882 RepID=UPI00160B134D|nr:carboxymuconolactone decarboxylase family protein [Mycobacterium sp. AZCC_0083]MBB5163433.1 AhpD family alkylhydroperoxidase [Mycobacterium sp. AZCC_0083]